MKWLLGPGIVLALSLPRLASADAMVWAEYVYRTRVDGNTVTICSDNVSPTMCGRSGGISSVMIRQDTRTKAVFEIPDTQNNVLDPKLCTSGCCRECFVDACVPPGTYRYGMAPALAHCGQYFGEVTVTASLSSGCTPQHPPEATSVTPPWTGVEGNSRVCPSDDDLGCALGGGRAVLGAQTLLFLLGLTLYLRRRSSR